MTLIGKVALITGAARGIGETAARLFASRGAQVVMCDLIEEAGQQVAEDIHRDGGSAFFVRMDVTDADSVKAAIAAATGRFGHLDILYNNAGGADYGDGRVTDLVEESFWRMMRINLFGTLQCCKYAIPEIAKAGGGSIINTSSIVALIGHDGHDGYTAAKGAVAAVTRSMAVEYAPQKIRVNAIAPGATQTEKVAKLVRQDKLPHSLLERHLLGLLVPEQVAHTALFLASEAASGITGQVMPVDSGATMTAIGRPTKLTPGSPRSSG